MANFRYSMRGRRLTFTVRRSAFRGRRAQSGHRPAGNSAHRVEVSGGIRRLDSLPIAGLNCSLEIRLPMDAFPCIITTATTPPHEAGIAQLVEQLICNQQVIGSNPIAGSTLK